MEYSGDIKPEFWNILCEVVLTSPCVFLGWEGRRVYLDGLQKLYDDNGCAIKINEEILEYFYMGYSTYRQITDIIVDFEKTIDDTITKNRLYRIPMFVNLMEGCLTNFFRVIVLIINYTVEKDYSNQRMLNPLCEVLRKNGFEELQNKIDVDIRNAINHGGVFFRENGRKSYFIMLRKEKLLKRY